MSHRMLSRSEILQLQAQHCSAEDWTRVRVRDPFHPERVLAVAFTGDVKLGTFAGNVAQPGGPLQPTGVYRSRVHQCTIGDNCLVSDVGVLANYDIGEGVRIENVGSLRVTGATSFGNGVEIDVLNEAGGRTLPLCDRMSAQLAYLIVFYRHDPELVARLVGLVKARADEVRSSVGTVGEGAEIIQAGVLHNVAIGPYARVHGAARLEEGTIASSKQAPTHVSDGVRASSFILLSGSRISHDAIVERCLIGQSVKLGKQYSAENSVFFCNSELFHGEGCSVFAGPYTVSHHKSTLLIAGFFSFYNAGSGTNQSNHMYKLGPVHQGVVERGCKTGSFSYLFWPTRVGAFSSVIGKHYTHFDTGDLPFAVINEQDGRSVCVPGMNLFTVGTRRDSAKWPARDGRTDPVKLDLIHFPLWSPWVIGKALRGMEKLNQLAEAARPGQEFLNFNGIGVQKMLVRTAGKYYEIANRIFVGGCLLRRLEELSTSASFAELRAALSSDVAPELYRWLDVNGLLVAEPALHAVLTRIREGEIADLDAFQAAMLGLHRAYGEHEWSWCARLIEQRVGKPLSSFVAGDLARIIQEWHETMLKFNNMVLQDARKEFEGDIRLGYGIDAADEPEREADFAAVRGTYEGNSFVKGVLQESEQAGERAGSVVAWLNALPEEAASPVTAGS